MSGDQHLSIEDLLSGLRAAGEPSRLRLLALLARSELTVKDATAILGQSQPRISRHLKLLAEAGLVRRYPEGSWVFYRLAEDAAGDLARDLVARLTPSDDVLEADAARFDALRKAKAEEAAAYFAAKAQVWDQERSLHVAERDVEAAMLRALGSKPFQSFLDLGTGTGRLLELFSRFTPMPLVLMHRMICWLSPAPIWRGRADTGAGAPWRHLCAQCSTRFL